MGKVLKYHYETKKDLLFVYSNTGASLDLIRELIKNSSTLSGKVKIVLKEFDEDAIEEYKEEFPKFAQKLEKSGDYYVGVFDMGELNNELLSTIIGESKYPSSSLFLPAESDDKDVGIFFEGDDPDFFHCSGLGLKEDTIVRLVNNAANKYSAEVKYLDPKGLEQYA